MRFKDRSDGGRRLARELNQYAHRHDVVVLALPRGGVPVAYEMARELHAPLDIFLVRKLGVPGHPELAMGAIASGGVRVLTEDLIDQLGIPQAAVEQVAEGERLELDRRDRLYRGERRLPLLQNRTVILVDDGLATGATMEAAIVAVRQHHPSRVVVAAPVGARETCERLARIADEVICAETPEPFQAVGLWYERFDQTSDEEVIELLRASSTWGPASRSQTWGAASGSRTWGPASAGPTVGPPKGGPHDRGGPHTAAAVSTRKTRAVEITIAGGGALAGDLAVPAGAKGLVVFAHGSGSSRFSSRNRYVADTLDRRGLATLLIDLLTQEEETIDQRTGHLRFDIPLLAGRLISIADWAPHDTGVHRLPIGLFGASTGGGAALLAAAQRPAMFAAVVSRGGRPDLAGAALARVTAPTLLIVGERDEPVIELNRLAMQRLTAPVRLEIVPRATHLFEEPGTLERVAELAGDWFDAHFRAQTAGIRPAPVRSTL